MSVPIGSPLRAALVCGSPSSTSRSKRLLDALAIALEGHGVEHAPIDLARLSAEALLGRGRAPDVDAALDVVRRAAIIAVGTPVYRATYSGLLKVFFDLLEPGALRGRVGIAVASGGSPTHQLAIEHGIAPLLASVGAAVVPTSIYGTDALFADADLPPALNARIARAADEAVRLASALAAEPFTLSTSVSP